MKMKTWGIIALLCCAILLIGIPAAAGAEDGADFVFWESSDSISMFGYKGTDTEIVIPAEINGKPVTRILGYVDMSHYQGSPLYDTDYLPYLFSKRSDLVSISIPATVTSIGAEAFLSRDGSLREINVDAGNPVYASVDGVLFDRSTLTLVQYPACKPDEEYLIPRDVQRIERLAFSGCVNLRSVVIPDSMTAVDPSAFEGCKSLAQVTIPDSVTVIGSFAFCHCDSLEQVILPASVTRISFGAFSSSGLTGIDIPDGVTAIDVWAFQRCPNLTRVTMADSVTEIGYSAFGFCPVLTDIRLSAGLTGLGGAFEGCESLSRIVIPDQVKSLNTTFRNCTALTDVTLPDSLREIGEAAFMGCTALETLRLPSALRYIGSSAFAGCTALRYMDFSAAPALLAIDKDAFSACTALQEITLPDGMPSLGDRAFELCESLETVNWIHVPVPETLLGEGEINYLPAADRLAMIRILARHAAREKGYTVIADTDKDGNPVDKDVWLGNKISALEQAITESRESIAAIQAEIDNPETPENKKKVLASRIASTERTIGENEQALAGFRDMQLLTDSEAQLLWWMDTGIFNDSRYDTAIYECWQDIYVRMQNGEGLPEGFATLIAYLIAEDGLGIGSADVHALEHNTFTVNGDGTVFYMPGPGDTGIGSFAFGYCTALTSVTIPASVAQIAPNAFAGCSAGLAVIAEPGSYAEQFCLQNNIPCSAP